MNPIASFCARSAILMAFIGAFANGPLRAVTFDFPRFDTNSNLKILGYTAVHEGKLRLSPAIPGAGTGGAWLPEKQLVRDGFETTFQIQITEKHYGADGLAFVIQNGTPTPTLGEGGGNLCYGGISNQVVVHFENYHWLPSGRSIHYDEIAIQAADTPATPLFNVPTNSLATAGHDNVYSDGKVHTVKIAYNPGSLRVYLDSMDHPIITTYVNLDRVMNLDHGRAWVGFTAASGAEWQNHDVVSWKFATTDVEPDFFRLPAKRSATTNTPIYLGPASTQASSQPVALPVDHNFGYALPEAVHMAGRIMVSTNLVHWETLTNASYYFRDRDSTNYPSRFYRFETN